MKRLAAPVLALGTLAVLLTSAYAAISYFQGFETDTFDWTGVTRVPSGTNGITSAEGSFHGEAASGAFTRFGGFEATFPSGGYSTSIDIYLDVGAGFANDKRFDWSSAINRIGTNAPFCTTPPCHLRDFVFNAGFYNDDTGPGAGDNRFVVSASNNATRSGANPKNPERNPVAIDETGWYTFRHDFYNNGGVLAVDLTILDSVGNVVGSWTLSDATDVIGVNVGGHRYGWLVFHEFSSPMAIDNVRLTSINEPSTRDDCKNGGWETRTDAEGNPFRNQGQCVSYVSRGGS